MAGRNIEVSVLFADVCGSTRLYETLGDEQAQAAVGACLTFLRGICEGAGGTVVKTIGDEIMCRFDAADEAVSAAREIQATNSGGVRHAGQVLQLRIGLHHGGALLDDDGDVFGDAVNVAARMAGIAKAGQVITTGPTVELLGDELRDATREVDRTTVKGRSETLAICEVLWEEHGDVTRIVSPDAVAPAETAMLRLTMGPHVRDLRADDADGFTMGRGSQCSLVVPGSLASRVHCRIDYRRGRFVLVDQSTNGTFVRTQDGEDVYLRREELLIWGAGSISLGEEVDPDAAHLVRFSCH